MVDFPTPPLPDATAIIFFTLDKVVLSVFRVEVTVAVIFTLTIASLST